MFSSFQVNSEQRQEGLLVTGVREDGVLDFGDCYSGNGACQLLTLRNVTQEVRSTLNVKVRRILWLGNGNKNVVSKFAYLEF